MWMVGTFVNLKKNVFLTVVFPALNHQWNKNKDTNIIYLQN